jgi:hypothetical protein
MGKLIFFGSGLRSAYRHRLRRDDRQFSFAAKADTAMASRDKWQCVFDHDDCSAALGQS